MELKKIGVHLRVPEMTYTTDNAAMIAVAGVMNMEHGNTIDPLTCQADPNMRLV
jgi:tRNA A37 threonylcarbamoyltransferase TsaD